MGGGGAAVSAVAAAAADAALGAGGADLGALPVLPGGGDPDGPAGALLVRAADGRALGLVAAPYPGGGEAAEEVDSVRDVPGTAGPDPPPPSEDVRSGLEAVRGKRASGNAAFGAGELELAVERYAAALERLARPPLLGRRESNAEAVPLHCNLAAVARRQRDAGVDPLLCNRRVLEHCEAALTLDARSVKALYRRAEAQAWSGHLYGARATLDRALREAPEHQEILALSDLCDDGLEAGEALDSPGAGAEEGGGRGEGENTPERVPEGFESFVAAIQQQVVREFEEKGEVVSAVFLRHTRDELGQDGKDAAPQGESAYALGTVEVAGAFESLQNLQDATQFIRRQHFAQAADCMCVAVDKAHVTYPLVWWAHPWPGDQDEEGVFVEAHWKRGHATWFLPRGPGATVLGEPILLHPETALLDEVTPLFL